MKLEYYKNLLKSDRVKRMEEIIKRLKYIDVKRFRFIDDDILPEVYEPYRLEAIALRLEYKELENG